MTLQEILTKADRLIADSSRSFGLVEDYEWAEFCRAHLNEMIGGLREDGGVVDQFIQHLNTELNRLGIDTSSCDGDETPHLVIAGWIAGRIKYAEEERDSALARAEELERKIDIIETEWERQKNLFPVLSKDGWMDSVIADAKRLTPSPAAETQGDELSEWLRGKIANAEKAVRAREQAEATFRSGDDAEWEAAADFHPSTARKFMNKADRLEAADAEHGIAVRCRREVDMFKALQRLVAEPGAAMRAMIANEDKLRADFAALRNAAEGMVGVLSVARCPNCDGSGAFMTGLTDAPELQQCQWCDEQKTATAAFLALQPEGWEG